MSFFKRFARRLFVCGAFCISILLLAACASQPTPAPIATAFPLPTTTREGLTPLPITGATPQLSNQQSIQLFDGHLHYSQDVWENYPVNSILALMDQTGIQRALVSSTPNEGTLRLHNAAPTRIIPELRPYRTRADMDTWFSDFAIVSFIDEELKRGVYRGIGEFHLYGDAAQSPVVKRLVDLAVERGLPLHAHSDESAIEHLFAANPHVKIMWAHTGMSTPIATVEKLLAKYPNLWAELSYRSDIVQNGKLDPAWRTLFLRFPDRFVYGSDTWIEARWEGLPGLITTARGWLAELPSDVAAKVASRNLEALYGK